MALDTDHYSDADHAELRRLIALLRSGELEIWMLQGGKGLPAANHERLVRHLIHLDYQLAKAKAPSVGLTGADDLNRAPEAKQH